MLRGTNNNNPIKEFSGEKFDALAQQPLVRQRTVNEPFKPMAIIHNTCLKVYIQSSNKGMINAF